MTRARRGYWLSMAALVVALPAALAAHGWGDIADWYSENSREPVRARMGEPADYGGARWTVTHFTRLASGEARAAVLAEFEAVVGDPGALAAIPCQVRLADGQGRKWEPVLFADPVIRKTYPEALERGLCGGSTFATATPGAPAKMAASFEVPSSASGLTLSIMLYSARPAYLSVSEPGD